MNISTIYNYTYYSIKLNINTTHINIITITNDVIVPPLYKRIWRKCKMRKL